MYNTVLNEKFIQLLAKEKSNIKTPTSCLHESTSLKILYMHMNYMMFPASYLLVTQKPVYNREKKDKFTLQVHAVHGIFLILILTSPIKTTSRYLTAYLIGY